MRIIRFGQQCLFLMFGALLVGLASCADAAPELVTATGAMVFDYADSDTVPAARLAVFVQTESEAQRVQSILAIHKDSGYHWKITAPKMLKSGDKQWACYTNLLPPEHAQIPLGTYDFQYLDAAGEEAWSTFTVQYPEQLLETKAADIKSVISGTEESYALYDKNGVLIYFGKKKNAWRENANILRDYTMAVTLRHCLSTHNNRVVCLLPVEYLIEPPKDEAASESAEAKTDDSAPAGAEHD